jgi:hypothetical protein
MDQGPTLHRTDVASGSSGKSASEQQEDSIIRAALVAVIDGGYRVDVHNGEEACLQGSTDVEAIIASLRQTDSDVLSMHRAADGTTASLLLVYGNDPYEVMADWSVSIEPELADAVRLAEQIEGQY